MRRLLIVLLLLVSLGAWGANTTYYVDTDVIGGDSSGDSWGNAFATLAAAEALNLDTTTGATDGTCTINARGTAADTTALTWGGWTTDAAGYVHVVGDFAGANWDATKYHMTIDDANAIDINDNYLRFSNIQIEVTGLSADRQVFYIFGIPGGGSAIHFDSVYIRGASGDSNGLMGVWVSDSDATVSMYNCITTDMASVADTNSYGFYNSLGTSVVYNSVFYNMRTGLRRDADSLTVANLAVFNTNDDFNGTITITKSASDDDDAESVAESGGGATWPDDFTDAANGDFSLVAASSLIGSGDVDPGTGLFSDDIVGTARGVAWDIGAFEYVGGPATYTLTYDDNTSTGGAVPVDGSSPYEESDTVTVLGNTGTLVKTGSYWSGWNTAADGSGTTYITGSTFSMPAANTTLYALWVAATTVYVRDGASGGDDGTDWTNAYDDLPAVLTRGATYYIADGDYSTYDFNDTEVGSSLIFITKATAGTHGTETGWDAGYGDGQGVFTAPIAFTTGYYTLDGGQTITTPSSIGTDYGIKITEDSTSNITGIVRIGTSAVVSYITLQNVWVYNTSNGSVNNGTVGVRFNVSYASHHIKILQSYLQNCGKDGIQISKSDYILVERCYIERYGLLTVGDPDYHGQTVQLFYGSTDIVFRYNTWESNEGQALISLAGITGANERIRFYGNTVFVPHGETSATPGFNGSGGLIGDISDGGETGPAYLIAYNNTFVNIGDDYGGVAIMSLYQTAGNNYLYNNLYYNCGTVTIDADWTASDYHASGGGDNITGDNKQVDIPVSTFISYTGNNFKLGENTDGGLDLSGEGWWSGGVDAFFGTVDSEDDLLGVARATWSRGAYEYAAVTTYTVTYDGNTSSGGSVPTDFGGPYEELDTVTVLGNTGTLWKAGYVWVDWDTAANGSGTNYSADDTFYMPGANTTLYAQWSASGIGSGGQIIAAIPPPFMQLMGMWWMNASIGIALLAFLTRVMVYVSAQVFEERSRWRGAGEKRDRQIDSLLLDDYIDRRENGGG